MNASFGIDHPLLATHDITGLRDRLIELGFNMTAIGKHPWGTSTSLAMFDRCLLEIMGIFDTRLIDENPADDFRFGRHVYEHLSIREGVALTALHSTNSQEDADHAQSAGFRVAGHLEFGRDVMLPDGTAGRTKTTLALLPDDICPRLSFFLCQQHRPELIYVPQWLKHPNKVNGICGISIVAEDKYHSTLAKRFRALYGNEENTGGQIQFQTANGIIRIVNSDTFQNTIGPLSNAIIQEQTPTIASIEFKMQNPTTMHRYVEKSGFGYDSLSDGIVLTSPEQTANTTLCFRAS